MGVKADRVLDPFTGPFEKLSGFAPVPAGTVGFYKSMPVAYASPVTWYTWTRGTNDAFAAANRLMKAGQEVYTCRAPVTWLVPCPGRLDHSL